MAEKEHNITATQIQKNMEEHDVRISVETVRRHLREIWSFQRNLNANFMYTIYEQGLLASTFKLFGEGNIDWILQEDNDPKHQSKITKKWKEENGIKELPWPSMSL
ncbi:16801_t:CDS:2 [Funneliformis geosporum]|uniref:16801_t:CDS:1 n=1 Tax=Funneliformis geosporum TaxID=1117311 RepID=A0A9W4T222_9GLOM|nr:16801_t:CDS:2 [Funneliformis geosporum]